MHRSPWFRSTRSNKPTHTAWRAMAVACAALTLAWQPSTAGAARPDRLLPGQVKVQTADYLVPHVSTVPANAGAPVELRLHERMRPGAAGRAHHDPDPVVLMIPGSATATVPTYDLDFQL